MHENSCIKTLANIYWNRIQWEFQIAWLIAWRKKRVKKLWPTLSIHHHRNIIEKTSTPRNLIWRCWRRVLTPQNIINKGVVCNAEKQRRINGTKQSTECRVDKRIYADLWLMLSTHAAFNHIAGGWFYRISFVVLSSFSCSFSACLMRPGIIAIIVFLFFSLLISIRFGGPDFLDGVPLLPMLICAYTT